MNKKSLKIAGWALGLSLAVAGIGAVVAGSMSKPVESEAAATATTKFALINSVDDLEANKSYIITSGISGSVQAMGSETNTNNRKTTPVTVDASNKITFSDAILGLTLEEGTAANTWKFKTENYKGTSGYFTQGNQTSSNYLKIGSEGDNFTITFSGNAATITSKLKSSRNILRYNSSSSLFACYSSGQNNVYLWKEVAAATDSLSKLADSFDLYIGDDLDLTTCVEADGPNVGTLRFAVESGSDYGELDGSTLTGLDVGTVTIKADFSAGTVTPVYFDVKVAEKPILPTWKKVTDWEDYTGLYLLVSGTKALDGSVELTKYNDENQFDVTIESNGTIEGDYTAKAFEIKPLGDGYSLQSAEGSYYGATTSGNLDAGESASLIVFNGTTMTSNDLTLRYNANYFRFYSNATTGSSVSFYKLDQTRSVSSWIDGSLDFAGTPDNEENATRASNACLGETGKYMLAKKALNAAEAAGLGTMSELKAGKNGDFKAAYARYTSWAEINNDAAPFDGLDEVKSTIHASGVINIGNHAGTNAALIAAVVAGSGALVAGSLLLFRKKKEN